METIEKSIEVLNDLIEINNDRVAGYAEAIENLSDEDLDLKVLFQRFKEQSRSNVHELGTAINQHDGEVEMGMSSNATMHRVWLDIKATFTGHTRKGILAECERGEDAIKKAYQQALFADSGLSPEFTQLVTRQQEAIVAAHDQIKTLRDLAR